MRNEPKLVRVAQQPLHDGAPQTSDLLDIAPLLWTAPHNLSWTQSTVKDQVGQSLLSWVGKQRLEDVPDLTARTCVFHLWFTWLSWRRPRAFSWTPVRPQHIQDSPIQTCPQGVQCRSKRGAFYSLVCGGSLPEALKRLG